ncbi:glutathione S-transferase family protein [Solimonas marina]|uniref:glutathione transferase n=1 Tax=Solimonas marina TaxID=2714601 RepID=A0A970BAS9_9GAMM|nr:glutathione S-transferase [Solimonas marina]NKF23691.1 glutathione S-transferase [Solimonas marina]
MITVHHLNNSRSQRVLWLLEELGLPYEVKRYERDAKTMLAPAALKAVHPLGKSPVITDATTDGTHTIAESGAIFEYILERYGNGRLQPQPGTPERLRYSYWMHYAEGSLMPLLVMTLIFSRIVPSTPALFRPIARAIVNGVHKQFLGPNLKTQLDYVDQELAAHTWFAGEAFSAADIQMSFDCEAAMARGDAPRPHIGAFVEKIHARPAYQRALERGGPYQIGH